MATLELIVGPMFSGKSTELMRRCSTYTAIGKQVLVINHSLDTRCGNEIKTHSQQVIKAIKVSSLTKLVYEDYPDVIAIDEAQFFDDLYPFIESIEKENIVIIVAGLDGDYMRKPFGHVLQLVPIADSITKLQSMCNVCKDGTKGSFTKRIGSTSGQICVGANDLYLSVCRKHYFQH